MKKLSNKQKWWRSRYQFIGKINLLKFHINSVLESNKTITLFEKTVLESTLEIVNTLIERESKERETSFKSWLNKTGVKNEGK